MTSLIQNLLTPNAALLAQTEYSYSASAQGQAPGPLFWICWLAFAILIIAAWWKIFTKAGQPGWASIIPTGSLAALTEAGAEYFHTSQFGLRFSLKAAMPSRASA